MVPWLEMSPVVGIRRVVIPLMVPQFVNLQILLNQELLC
jgi:hypothetical protein